MTVRLRLCYSRTVPDETRPVRTPNILLVDDNRDGLLVRRSLLEEVGYRVEIAPNGEEGLKLFEAANFDVVVTDYRMPRMNGVGVDPADSPAESQRPHHPALRLRGSAGPDRENTGADAVIAKSSNEAGAPAALGEAAAEPRRAAQAAGRARQPRSAAQKRARQVNLSDWKRGPRFLRLVAAA